MHTRPEVIDAVVFDMDGVLVSSADLHWHAFRETFAAVGVDFAREHYDRVGVGTARDVVIRTVLGDVADDELERLMAEKERHGNEYLERVGLEPIPGSVELARTFQDAGLRLAVATASRTPRPFLRSIGALELFDVIVDRLSVERPKPDPQIYLCAAEKLGLAPAACLAIEDSPAGVAAARGAGMHVIAVTTTHTREELAAAHEIYDAFDEIDVTRLVSG